MEDLNKTQIVLLTLLVSFVTSIATGIVTVTLIDQAPPGVTQTINKVVERTIETVLPGEKQVTTVVKEVIVKEEDLIANAVEKSSKSLVLINALDGSGSEVFLGLGVIISGDGYIVTDKNRIAGNRNNLVIVNEKESFNAEVVSADDDTVALLKIRPLEDSSEDTDKSEEDILELLTPASLADSGSIRLGQSVVSLGEKGDTVLIGIVSHLGVETIKTEDEEGNIEEEEKLNYITTTINMNSRSAGGPLTDTDGNILGINIISEDGGIISIPINDVRDILFSVIDNKEDTLEEDLTEQE